MFPCLDPKAAARETEDDGAADSKRTGVVVADVRLLEEAVKREFVGVRHALREGLGLLGGVLEILLRGTMARNTGYESGPLWAPAPASRGRSMSHRGNSSARDNAPRSPRDP